MTNFKDFGFQVCRVCMIPRILLPDKKLKNLFDEVNFPILAIFKEISGVDINNDKRHYEALICNECDQKLTKIAAIKRKVLKAEQVYFSARRWNFSDLKLTTTSINSTQLSNKTRRRDSNTSNMENEEPSSKRSKFDKLTLTPVEKRRADPSVTKPSAPKKQKIIILEDVRLKSPVKLSSLPELSMHEHHQIEVESVILQTEEIPKVSLISSDEDEVEFVQETRPKASGTFSCNIPDCQLTFKSMIVRNRHQKFHEKLQKNLLIRARS